jgi:hypothetical protein
VLFHVIPAEAGIQSRSEWDFKRLRIAWTPVFTGETNRRQFFHTFPQSGERAGPVSFWCRAAVRGKDKKAISYTIKLAQRMKGPLEAVT